MKMAPLLVSIIMFVNANLALALELTLEQCVDLAVKNNSGLKAFEMETASAGEEVNISQKSLFPSLKLNGNYFLFDKPMRLIVDQNSFGPGIPPQNTQITTQDSNWYFLNVILEQPLFTGGKLKHSYLKSKALNEEALHRVERQKRQLIFNVRQSFYEALNAQLYTKIVEKALESKRERLRVLQELLVEGYASQEDILRQETDIQFTELELFKGKNREATAVSRLNSLMQYNGNEGLQLKGKPSNGVLTASIEQIKEAAAINREDLKAALAKIKAAEEDIAIAKSDFYPHATVQGNFIQQKETNITRPQVWMFTAQLEWSLFEWGKTRSELRKNAALKQKVQYESEELKKDVILEVERIWRAVKEQEKTVKAQEKRARTAEYRLNLMTDKYAEEKVKLSEVIDMEAEFIKDCNEYSMAMNDLNSTFAKLEASTSSHLGTWIKIEEVYFPDFDSHVKKLQNLLNKKKASLDGLTSGGVAENQQYNMQEIVNKGDDKTDSAAGKGGDIHKHGSSQGVTKQPQDASPRAAGNRGVPCSSVEVQVAAFKTKKQAETYRKAIKKMSGERDIRIVRNGGYFKVRITGFRAHAEAEEMVRCAGIKDYLIVKASYGY